MDPDSDAWSRHPMVRLRHTLPAGVSFDQVVVEEGFSRDEGYYQGLSVKEAEPPTPVPVGLSVGEGAEVDPALEEAWEAAPEEAQRVLVWLRTGRDWDEASVTHEVEHGLFEGTVTDEASMMEARAQAVEVRGALASAALDAFLGRYPEIEVLARASGLPTALLSLTAADGAILLLDDEVVSLELEKHGGTEEAHASTVADTMGVRDFHLGGYRGGRTAETGFAVATLEGDNAFPWHPGFRQEFTIPGLPTMMRSRVRPIRCILLDDCEDGEWVDEHATAVAGILIGDTTRGQDPGLEGAHEASYADSTTLPLDYILRNRSGMAGDIDLWSYAAWPGSYTSVFNAYRHMRNAPVEIPIVSISASYDAYKAWYGQKAPTCTATSPMVRAVNAYYEDGGLTVKSAGNVGSPLWYDTDNDRVPNLEIPACTVTEPGAALSAMTVSGVNNAFVNGGLPNPIRHENSSYSDPAKRHVVKLAGPWNWAAPYREDGPVGWDYPYYGPSLQDPELLEDPEPYQGELEWGGTSMAAPAVAGAAAVYRDWYLDNYTAVIASPGMLAAVLLQHGDRRAGDGSLLTRSFDSELGAGYLRINQPEVVSQSLIQLCLGQNSHRLYVNQGNPVPSGISELRGTLWWYDVDHDEGGPLTQFDLRLWRVVAGNRAMSVAWSTSTWDNMERISYVPAEGSLYFWTLEPVGAVAADHICNASTRLYFVQTMRGAQ